VNPLMGTDMKPGPRCYRCGSTLPCNVR
jgi:hypothetical protein